MSQLQLRCKPQLTTADAANAQVTLQAARWDIARFFKQLQQLVLHHQQEQQKRQQQEQQRLQQAPALLSSLSPVPRPQSPAQGKSSRQKQAAAAAVRAVPCQPPGGTIEVLLGDVLTKQQALERLQRQLDLTGQHAEAADGRVAELQAANRSAPSVDVVLVRLYVQCVAPPCNNAESNQLLLNSC